MRSAMRFVLCLLVVLLAAVGAPLLWPHEAGPGESELSAVAANWVGAGEASPPRRDGDEWEVDVRRPDGSVVEVTLGADRRLLGLDEERGPRAELAPDELRGPGRARAARAALAAAGPGTVLSVERDEGHAVEVGIRRPGGETIEVELDRRLRATEVEPEDPAD